MKKGDVGLERDGIRGISSDFGLESHLLRQDVDNERGYMAKIERLAVISSIYGNRVIG